jgi:hypothetical protein
LPAIAGGNGQLIVGSGQCSAGDGTIIVALVIAAGDSGTLNDLRRAF